ncbi:hypothetical protein [Kaistella pullorum]|uniref:Uncharacterized protein n=1 Tax=Kaistella pullorum TaxID=2763074 RepID=A0ABR8WQ98_9FLAO|nr:hypothetical protein [Kaistella pullorum]MBD8019117.1 hypothetical protein [Kaistella pullorum]
MKRNLLFIFLILSTFSYGQGRKFLKDKIREWGECKNVAMTLTGGDIALKGKNGWAASGVPKSLTNKLSSLNENNELIDDIVLTENGRWLILWGNNGISSYGTPTSLDSKLTEWNDNGEMIYSITFNDNGDWVVISKTKFSASSSKIIDWISEGEQKYGELWAASITNTGLVVVYERGYKFLGDVPSSLKNKLDETKLNVFRLKFLSDGAYFIADFAGNYAYYF